ncbi:hypothetical protein KR093_006345 [Drosophila rubida]|uniref:Small ribosomal subunit protein eS28 n=1 Tax=Drosophila rubida TaxID=30044 RepID=A0AAD4K513_9MUSC|nr:hypothetical protein KR093_006345 [Drosophila rubida]
MDPPSVPARVVKVLGRIGARGLLTEVRVELLKFPRMQMLRAVKGWFPLSIQSRVDLQFKCLSIGPVRLGDIIRIPDIEEDVWRR